MKSSFFKFLLAGSLMIASAQGATILFDLTPGNNRATMNAQAGQTFTTGTLDEFSNRLSTISIYGDSGGSGNPNIVSAQLWLDTDGNFATWDPGALVATSTNSQVIASENRLFSFNFSGEILQSNTVYVLSFTDGTSNHVQFRSDVTNAAAQTLSDGALFASGAQPFGGAFDASFQLTAIPEPGSVLLLSGSILGLLRRRR